MTDVFSPINPRPARHAVAFVLCAFGALIVVAAGCPSPRTPTPVGCTPFSQACVGDPAEPMICDDHGAYHRQGDIPCPFGQTCMSDGRRAFCGYPDASADAGDASDSSDGDDR